MDTAEQTNTIKDRASALLAHAAGYAAHRTIAMGLRTGIVEELEDHADGITAEGLADRLGFDPFYVGVWCRAALAAGLCERSGDRYRLMPHAATLLLDARSPANIGALFTLFEQDELFARFERVLPTGDRLWWDECSPEWIAGVAASGTPFNTRLIPGGLSQVPGLTEELDAGCRVVDTACGAGVGVVRLADHYPECGVVGIDGDAHSVELAAERVARTGVSDRVRLEVSPLEDMKFEEPATLAINNISMHECRDIDHVTANIHDGLEAGGWFVISDFPFPETDEGLATVPGQLMAGIQFFEAQIDDQLLPRSAYDELLQRHGFVELGSAQLTPVHALTWGRRPA